MNRIEIGPSQDFSFGGENFVIALPAKERRLSTSEAFTIAKNEPYLRVYEELASAVSPRSILELGIFQGGSYVLLDKLFSPRRMSAVDISPQPVPPLLAYIADKEGRFVHFSASQTDRKILEDIVRNELADELDLVVDDASHDAPFSKRHALSNLLFEQLMLMGSTSLISEIRVWKFLYLIRKATTVLPAPDEGQKDETGSIFDQILNRGREWSLI